MSKLDTPTEALEKVSQATHTTEELLSADNNILDQLLLMFEKGFNQPIIYWQVACVALSLLCGWCLASFLKRLAIKRYAQIMAQKQKENLERPEPPSEGQNEKKFWLQVYRSLASLFLSLSWALFSMLFLVISTLSARIFNLLPKHSLPIESIFWLILSAYVIIRVFVFILHHSLGNGKFTNSLDGFLTWSIWLAVALQIVGILPKCIEWMETTKISLGQVNVSIWSMGMAVFSIALALFIAKWIGQFFERWLTSLPNLQTNVRVVVIRVVKVLLVFIAILFGLASVGIDVTVLGVFGGAIGVGLGFGLQKIASNYVSGFIILLDRSVKIGDLVSVAGVDGIVTDIKTRYTVIRAYDGSVTIIPNEAFVTSNVKNSSYLQGPGRTTVSISVDYSSNVDEVIELMTNIVRKQPRILVEPPPYTILTNFGDDGIDLTSYFWVADPEKGTATLRSNISREMLREFNNRGINIPYPQRDLRILSIPEISCQIQPSQKSKDTKAGSSIRS